LLATFVALLAFHSWLLYRMVSAQNWLLAALLVLAIGLFLWRIAHYAAAAHASTLHRAALDREQELRQIRLMAPVLSGALVLHAWLISLLLPIQEYAFVALLFVAVGAFVYRLALYAKRYSELRGRSTN